MKRPDDPAATALALACSPRAADHERLRATLASEDSLLRLDAAEDYSRMPAADLRVARVVHALVANPAPVAAETIAFLAADPVFTGNEARQEVLLRESVAIRPAPPALARFFDAQCAPDAANLHLAIDVVVANGSEPAIAVLERRLADPGQEPENVGGWMRDSILRHRNDEVLLLACERLLAGSALSDELKIALVEALFDYRPEEWYPPDSDVPRPPDRHKAAPAAKAVLQRIAARALQQESLPGELRASVRAALPDLR